tara:strand:+ start:4466 stop:4936 length:471 start_codon:yes stop_codon:yes gene_type:complete
MNESNGQAPGQNLPGLNAKGAFDAITKSVLEDEPCYLLAELSLLNASNMARHRYQVLKVVRADRLVTAYIDLGPASGCKSDEFTIPGGYVDENGRGHVFSTVGELRETANEMRAAPRREVSPPDLQGAYNNLMEEKERFKARQSVYGYGGELVRST